MSKKDKKIAVEITDSQVAVSGSQVAGYHLTIGKKNIGEIAEIDEKFAVVEKGEITIFFKTLEKAVESVIENYNLTH
ncbi:DUF2969 domain-containing protein [Streptococcus chenjunshii]|uniref:DUF2969 domain-containing protein n=1 Tax=Streptococcus chenjunshii TaxID=2173853 RepID=A0A372KPD9_9STRE|nr:DUF2969 domain-containing protein [Streptococcus chenjunshii]AXQ78605.1 DUF2969 domain-containing protein [Streptococcus chenjunshii]RFU51931.1 DUF2969 domain-containing protein [Streptococcus chenjunshii]RFU54123.1 DUF2969 domain-containing protein [Streptococcus chenjunshii]